MSSSGSENEGTNCISIANGSISNTSTSNALPVNAGIPTAADRIVIVSDSNSSGHSSSLTRLSFHGQGSIVIGIQRQSSTNTIQQSSPKNG
eukprot:15048243-Ditylum_brightwellii.AAC.1